MGSARARILALSGSLLIVSTTQANEVRNGGFDAGLDDWQWTPSAGVAENSGVAALNDAGIYFTDTFGDQYGSALWQVVATTPGAHYRLAFDYALSLEESENAFGTLYWQGDATGDPLDWPGFRPLFDAPQASGAPAGWQSFETDFEAQEDYAAVFFEFWGTGPENVGLRVDNVSLTLVPLPMSAWLLAPALLWLGTRRRARAETEVGATA